MRTSKRAGPLLAVLAWLATSAFPANAQTTTTAEPFQTQFPDPVRYKPVIPEVPELQIAEVKEIALVGPLLSGPALVDGRIEILTAEGLARASWNGDIEDADVDRTAGAKELPDTLPWSLSPDGKYRARPANERQLLVQKTCRGCDDGWRRDWRLRVPGLAQVPPVVTENRVYYGASDNQVFAVKRKNGHRVWATALEGRVLRALHLWVDLEGPLGISDIPVAGVLVVPEPGSELILLDSLGGRPSIRYRVKDEGDRWVGSALATPDGYVVLARQGYTEEDASLVVLKLRQNGVKAPSQGESGGSGYNPPSSDEATPEPAR